MIFWDFNRTRSALLSLRNGNFICSLLTSLFPTCGGIIALLSLVRSVFIIKLENVSGFVLDSFLTDRSDSNLLLIEIIYYECITKKSYAKNRPAIFIFA